MPPASATLAGAPTDNEQDATLCMVGERRAVNKADHPVWRGRWFAFQGKDAGLRQDRELRLRPGGRMLERRRHRSPRSGHRCARMAKNAGPSKLASTHFS